MILIGKIVLGVVLTAAFLGTVLGLPGTVLVLVAAVVWDLCAGFDWVPVWQLAVLLVLTLVAEFGDQILSAWGVRKYEGTRRGMLGSTIGGFLGAIGGGSLGSVLGGPGGPAGVLAGFALGPLIGGMVAGFIGAMLLERISGGSGRTWRDAARAGWGAFAGRTLGVLLKFIVCAGMVAMVAYAVYSHRT